MIAGCFHDDPPRQLGCDPQIEVCGASSGADSTTGAPPTTTTTTTGPGTTAEPTTGAPLDPSRAFRIESLEIVDPHLFLEMAPACTDVTGAINEQGIAPQIADGGFNLILFFDDIAALKPGLKEAESCDLDTRICVDKDAVALQVPAVLDEVGPCNTLDPAVLQAPNVSDLNVPAPPCYRTASANIALPIEGAAVPLNMRDAQIVFNFDDPNDPQEVQNGLLYGFFTQASAEATTLSIVGQEFVLWPMMAPSEACVALFQDQLPSVDAIMDGMTEVTGVWMAVNFTARRVELLPPP